MPAAGAACKAFNGQNNENGDDHIASFGINVGVETELESAGYLIGVGYISDIGDADTLQDVILATLGSNDMPNAVSAVTANGRLYFGDFTVIGEIVAAIDSFKSSEVAFNGQGATPSAWSVELAYGLDLAGKKVVVATSYQATQDALSLELPEQRFLIGASAAFDENISLGAEFKRDVDYSLGAGGTGNDADIVTVKLAISF